MYKYDTNTTCRSQLDLFVKSAKRRSHKRWFRQSLPEEPPSLDDGRRTGTGSQYETPWPQAAWAHRTA